MANAVILFTGNVCSTPMIEYAQLCNDIFVPVREHFDYDRFLQTSLNEDKVSADFAQVLDEVLVTRDSTFLQDETLVRMRGGEPVPAVGQKPHVLFKWRSFPTDLPNSGEIAQVFEKTDTTPLVMLRKSLGHQALKVFLSEKVYGGRHQQFKARGMKPEAYEEYLREQDTISVHVTKNDMVSVRNIAHNFLNRTLRLSESAKHFFPHHATPKLLCAEDVFSPLIDVDQYNRALTALFGPITLLSPQPETALRKAGLEISHCTNAEEVFADPKIAEFERRYQAFFGGLKNILDV